MPVTIDGTSGITTPAISGLTTPVGISSGGTNITTYTTGDVLYASATNTLSKLGIGSSGQVLSVSGGVPAWATPATGALTLLNTTTVSAYTQIVDITTPFTSSYKHFLIVGTNIGRTGPTSSTTINLQIYRGGSLVTSGYAYDSMYTTATRASYAASSSSIPLLICMPDPTSGNLPLGGCQFYIWNAFDSPIYNITVTGQTNVNYSGGNDVPSGLANITAYCGAGTGAFGGIRMRNSDTTWGLFLSATFYIYGIS